MSSADPDAFLTAMEAHTARVRALEDDLRRTQADNVLLETILTILIRRAGGIVRWTEAEIYPAQTESRTLMLGALDAFLAETTGSTGINTTVFGSTAPPEVGQTLSIDGTEYEIETVTPTKIKRDEYGREVDWPGFKITAVTPRLSLKAEN
jgi:hypothetical protein